MHEVSCGALVAWLVQNFFRLEAIVFGCISWSPWADALRDHATSELYVSEGKE